MKIPPAIAMSYGNWLMIPNASNADGFEVMSFEEFAEHSEHITLETANDGYVYTSEMAYLNFDTFTGI